jgi:putative redox protein
LVQEISIGQHRLKADELIESGGGDSGPNPYELLLAALGTCTSMTVCMYAERKGWPLKMVGIRLGHHKIYAQDRIDFETKEGMLDLIKSEIVFVGELSDGQRQKLLEIANKCPVHRTLTSKVRVETRMAPVNVSAGS